MALHKYMRDTLPNATYLGFTGTPIESTDTNTPAVFGNYIDVYDIAQDVVLTERVRQNASIDWTIKESVRVKLKVIIKRTLRQDRIRNE